MVTSIEINAMKIVNINQLVQKSLILGNGYLSGLIFWFKALTSMHILRVPSLFLEKEWDPHKERYWA